MSLSYPTVHGSDTTLAEPSVLPACTVVYPNTDPSPNLCTYLACYLHGHSQSNPLFFALSYSPKSRSSDLPRFSTVPVPSPPKLNNTFSPMNFATGTRSGSLLSACEAPVFLPADQVLQAEFVPDMSDSSPGWYGNRVIGAAL